MLSHGSSFLGVIYANFRYLASFVFFALALAFALTLAFAILAF